VKPPLADSVLDLIGKTPILHLGCLAEPGAGGVYAKLEFLNPGGSIKDRAALGMILAAEREGKLRPGGTIIEPTAGNTGIGLALVGAVRGYRTVLVVPDGFSREKTMLMLALGGDVVSTPHEDGMKGAIDRAYELSETMEGAFVPQQFANPANPEIHYETTGREIYEQMEGRVDAVAIGGGTCGTFTGVARYLRERIDRVRCILVEPQGSVFGGGEPGSHDVEGIGNSFIPDALDRSLVDEVMMIDDEEAFAMCGRVAREAGLLAGGSSGANLAASLHLARRLGEGARVVTVIPDTGERYLSKDPYGRPEARRDA
jgi:cysteine synthase A